MMTKNLFKTLSKTPNFLNSPTSNCIYPFSLPSFSTNLFSNEQHLNPQSHIVQNHEIESKTLSEPSQIPYQSRVANWVHLIGTIKMPIKFLTCAHGKSWAGTLISQQQYSSKLPLWMPVIFQGDLAYTAMMHLKEDDVVYINGHLSPEPVPITFKNNQANFQVLVHNVQFVIGLNRMKKKFYQRSISLFNPDANQTGFKR